MSRPIFLLELALPEHPDRLVSEWVYLESGSVLVSLIPKPRAHWKHGNEYTSANHTLTVLDTFCTCVKF